MSKVIVIMADGCEEVEALTVVDVLRRGGATVCAASAGGSLDIQGAHSIIFKADALLQDIKEGDFDAVVIPGGMGGRNNILNTPKAIDICKKFKEEGKIVAAICAGPTVLGRNGLLRGITATCYPSLEGELEGCRAVSDIVVKDKNIITSQGPATAMAFSVELLKALEGEETAASVAKGLLL